MEQIHVLAVGDGSTASTVFRFGQYREHFAERGVNLNIHPRSALDGDLIERLRGQVVVNQKIPLRASLERHLRAVARRLVFDFDDAIWTRPGRDFGFFTRWRVRRRLGRCLRDADLVLGSSEYLLQFARRYNEACRHLPMAIDVEGWHRARAQPVGRVVLGWAGSPGNLPFLQRIEPALAVVSKRHPQVLIRIYCGRRPQLNVPFEHVPYAPGTEADFVSSLDIGLCPLPDDPFVHGKSPIKILQYYACGAAVVASPVGAARELLGEDRSLGVADDVDWAERLSQLVVDTDRRQALAQAGFRFVSEHHDAPMVADRLLGLLTGRA